MISVLGLVLIILLACQIVSCAFFPRKNNVCNKIPDYATLFINDKNCWYNPDVRSSMEEILKRNGYRAEKHKVTTEDGYILTMFRIPATFPADPVSQGRPILIQHGIGGTGVFWILQGQNSLAFFLSRNGYDVWLSTTRGGTYSNRHERLTTADPEYWNYSFHEHGIYDLPAMTTYISKITGRKGDITYIGHSMGTTMSYIYSILRKKHAEEHLNGIISFAPVAYTRNVKGLYRFLSPFADTLVHLLNGIGIYAIGDLPIYSKIISTLCGTYPSVIFCELSVALTSGLSVEEERPDLLPVFGSYFPAGTSLKLIQHFSQCINAGYLQFYDYGDQNIVKYNATKPPIYDLNAISVPVHLFVGQKDFIGNVEDSETLFRQLKSNRVPTSMSFYNYAHNDFFLGRNFENLYSQLLKTIRML
ncbi:unnamed protein product [Phaedon cochleariae]|uniref:Lipase n=1 Tax=Phaedon cochleariae TaxID=80249 RepID=A0A9P0DLL5_PHACE|nr:unnamed protein product [Phaedon cochleariae]